MVSKNNNLKMLKRLFPITLLTFIATIAFSQNPQPAGVAISNSSNQPESRAGEGGRGFRFPPLTRSHRSQSRPSARSYAPPRDCSRAARAASRLGETGRRLG